jgi:hypothetical protein
LDTEKYDVELDSMTDSMKTSRSKTVSFNQWNGHK